MKNVYKKLSLLALLCVASVPYARAMDPEQGKFLLTDEAGDNEERREALEEHQEKDYGKMARDLFEQAREDRRNGLAEKPRKKFSDFIGKRRGVLVRRALKDVIENKNFELFDILLEEHGALVLTVVVNTSGATALERVLQEVPDMANRLMRNVPDINGFDSEGLSSLMVAAHNSNKRAVRYLLECGADVSASNENGDTSLLLAVKEGCKDAVRWLVREKHIKKYDIKSLSSALACAKELKNKELVDLLKTAVYTKQVQDGACCPICQEVPLNPRDQGESRAVVLDGCCYAIMCNKCLKKTEQSFLVDYNNKVANGVPTNEQDRILKCPNCRGELAKIIINSTEAYAMR